jgi:hypothetical protein
MAYGVVHRFAGGTEEHRVGCATGDRPWPGRASREKDGLSRVAPPV